MKNFNFLNLILALIITFSPGQITTAAQNRSTQAFENKRNELVAKNISTDESKLAASRWLKFADYDLNAAKALSVAKPESLLFPALYHTQQAMEKALKAFLVMNKFEVLKTHDLEDLVKAAMKIDGSFKDILEKAKILTPFAISIRYPDNFYTQQNKMPDLELVNTNIKLSQEAVDFIKDKINKKNNLEIATEAKIPVVTMVPAIEAPVNVWQEFAKNSMKRNANTEEEIFELTDKVMKMGGNAEKGLLQLVKEEGEKRGKTNYDYFQYKADAIDKILNDKVRADLANTYHNQLSDRELNDRLGMRDGQEKKFVLARNYLAYNWIKHYGNAVIISRMMYVLLVNYYQSASIINQFPEYIKLFLIGGWNPNEKMESNIPSELILNHLISMTQLDNITSNLDRSNKILSSIKILLDYGANPNLKDAKVGFTPLEYARRILSELNNKELPIYKTLQEIIKLLEEAVANKDKEALKIKKI